MRRTIAVLVRAFVVVGLASSAYVVAAPTIPSLKDSMTVAEFETCGLHKLTGDELQALQAWIASRQDIGKGGSGDDERPVVQLQGVVAPSRNVKEEVVILNRSSGKYHCARCQWAARCTTNCGPGDADGGPGAWPGVQGVRRLLSLRRG